MANWLVTVDYDDFELDKAFDVLPKIYWKNSTTNQDKGLQVNDIVYVYVTKPVSKVMYQFKVIGHADRSEYPLAQKAFWKDTSQLDSIKGYAIFEKLKKLDKPSLSYDAFIRQKLIPEAPIQGRRTDRDKAKDDSICIFLDYIASEFAGETIETDYPDEAGVNHPKFLEGKKITVTVNGYERCPKAKAECIAHYGTRCYVCGMSFEHTYGAFAKDFIHVHHIEPLHDIGKEYEVDPKEDLRPVCPNCHAMLHKTVNGIPMTIEKLKVFYKYSLNNPLRQTFEDE